MQQQGQCFISPKGELQLIAMDGINVSGGTVANRSLIVRPEYLPDLNTLAKSARAAGFWEIKIEELTRFRKPDPISSIKRTLRLPLY